MNFLPDSRKLTGVIAFAFSLSTGLAQLLILTRLNHILDKDSFSRISTILQSFPVFFIMIEMGIQGEVIRRVSSTKAYEVLPEVIYLRLFASILTVATILLYGVISGFSPLMFFGMTIFSCAYIPASLLLTIEDWGYGKNRLIYIVMYKAGRLIAVLGFFASMSLVSSGMTRPYHLDKYEFILCFFVYPFSLLIFALPGLTALRKQSLLKFPGFTAIMRFVKDLKYLIGSSIFRWISSYLFFLLITTKLGETNLSSFNIAVMMITPVSLGTQIYINILMSGKFSGTFPLQFRDILGSFLFLSFAIGTYIACCSWLSIPTLFFERMDYPLFLDLFIPLAIAQVFIAISSIINLIAVSKNVDSIIISHTLSVLLMILAFWPLSELDYLSRHLTLAILFASSVAFLVQMLYVPKLFRPQDRLEKSS